MTARLLAIAVCVTVLTASDLSAQVSRSGQLPQRGSVELGGGGLWSQGFDLGPERARLSRSTATDRFDLFATDTDLVRSLGGYARLGFYLSREISVEAGLRYAQPTLSIQLSGDAESASDEEATAKVSQYVFDGSVLLHFTRMAFAGGRGVPFISAGGGHIRELYEGNELIETGRAFHVTAGLKYWTGGGRRMVGFRGELGISARDGGVDPGDDRRSVPFATAGLTLLF